MTEQQRRGLLDPHPRCMTRTPGKAALHGVDGEAGSHALGTEVSQGGWGVRRGDRSSRVIAADEGTLTMTYNCTDPCIDITNAISLLH